MYFHQVERKFSVKVAIACKQNVETFECSFVNVTIISRFFASKHLLIILSSRSQWYLLQTVLPSEVNVKHPF